MLAYCSAGLRTEAAGWFEQANSAAPAAIVGDVATYKTAHDEYASFLGTVDFNLDTVFSTPEGTQLAIDTSHSLTPAIVQYAIDDAGSPAATNNNRRRLPHRRCHPTDSSTWPLVNGHLDQR